MADLSVRRGCAFGAMAIALVIVALSAVPLMAAKAGAALTTIMLVVLLAKALNAQRKHYKRTELWILLDKKHGLPEAHAQRILMGVLREAYLRYADIAAMGALCLWLVALGIWLAY